MDVLDMHLFFLFFFEVVLRSASEWEGPFWIVGNNRDIFLESWGERVD